MPPSEMCDFEASFLLRIRSRVVAAHPPQPASGAVSGARNDSSLVMTDAILRRLPVTMRLQDAADEIIMSMLPDVFSLIDPQYLRRSGLWKAFNIMRGGSEKVTQLLDRGSDSQQTLGDVADAHGSGKKAGRLKCSTVFVLRTDAPAVGEVVSAAAAKGGRGAGRPAAARAFTENFDHVKDLTHLDQPTLVDNGTRLVWPEARAPVAPASAAAAATAATSGSADASGECRVAG